jgi:hypothetical protein
MTRMFTSAGIHFSPLLRNRLLRLSIVKRYMKKYILLFLPLFLFFTGCLSDNIDVPVVESRKVLQPNAAYYKSITGTLDLEIRWNPSINDYQDNFKGYFIKLYNSMGSDIPGEIDSNIIEPPIDSVHVPKSDTLYTFVNKVVQDGRYTVRIWGERVTDPATPNVFVLSLFPVELSFTFDSRPVKAPKLIFASSAFSSSVNLFWDTSASSSNKGFAGYKIRMKEVGNSAAHLIDVPYSTNNRIGNLFRAQVSVTGNPTPPVEKSYQFFIKAIRKDSVESDDSVSITWSGAERLSLPVKMDTGLFIGIIGFNYGIQQTDPNGSNALLQVSQSAGNFIIDAKNGTQFVKDIYRDTGIDPLDRNYLPAPFANSDFTETQLSFPATITDGVIVYALFTGGSRARLLFHSDSTSIANGNTIRVDASFQPIENPQLPFF